MTQIYVTYLMHLNHKDVTAEFVSRLINQTNEITNLPKPKTIVLHIGPDFTNKSCFIDKWKIFRETVDIEFPDVNIGFTTSTTVNKDIMSTLDNKLIPNVLFVDGYVINTSFIELCRENNIDIVSMITGRHYNIDRFTLFSKKYNALPYHIIMRWMIQQQGIKIVIMDREPIDTIIKRDYLKVTKICLGPKDFEFINKYLPGSY